MRLTLYAWPKSGKSILAGHRAECASVQTQGAALNVWAMGIVSMPVKAQTEAWRALNVAKMAIKGTNAARKSPSASSARPERISAPLSWKGNCPSYREALAEARSRCHRK